jgi:hypothetical protein
VCGNFQVSFADFGLANVKALLSRLSNTQNRESVQVSQKSQTAKNFIIPMGVES